MVFQVMCWFPFQQFFGKAHVKACCLSLRANLNRVNPSDCVDMDCDGLKKVLIQDMDGSLLGGCLAVVVSWV